MRPRLLTMRAFGPYGGTETINFTLLEDTNMFLIHGPTGSGKTTILDAICYALYGQTNGGERTAESMRSKFATSDEPAEVTLVFYLKGDEYKVIRSPRFERPKKRGEGFTIEEGKALLYKKEEEDYKLVAARLQEVDRKIEELLVFNIDQFRQVIMIAQNKFRELLTADSKARQKILQDIFETGVYQSVEKKLEERSNKLDEQMKAKNIQYEILMSQLKDIEHEGLQFYIETKVLNNAPEVGHILGNLIENYIEQLGTYNTREETIKIDLEKTQKALLEQNEKYTAFKELGSLQVQLDTHLAQAPAYQAYQEKVTQIEQILPVVPIEAEVTKYQETVVKTQDALKILQEEQGQVQSQLEQLIKDEQNYELEKLEIEEKKVKRLQLESYIPKMDVLDTLYKGLGQKEGKLKQFQIQREQLMVQLEQEEKAMTQIEEELKGKEALHQIILESQVNVQQMGYILDSKEEQARKQQERLNLLGHYKVIGAEITRLRLEEIAKQEEYGLYLERWMSGQAGTLADQLEDGYPCPVCGSVHHPQKATKIVDEVQTEDLKKLEVAKNLLLAQMSKKEEEQNGILTRGKAIQEEIAQIDEKLKGYAQTMNIPITEITRGYQEQLQQVLKDTKLKVANLEQLEGQILTYKLQKEQGQAKLEVLKESMHTCQIECERDKGKIEEIQKEVPQDLQTKVALSEAIEQLKKVQKDFETRYKAHQETSQIAKEKSSLLKGTLEEKQAYLIEQRDGLEQVKKCFQEALVSCKIAEIEIYNQLKQEVSQLETLNQYMISYEQEKAILNSKKVMLIEKSKDFTVEGFEDVKTQFDQLTKHKEQLQLELAEMRRKLSLYANVTEGIHKLYTESEAVARKQHVIGTMTALAKGKNSKGLSFERYIQSSIFDEVLESANQKLRPMTTSRYELYRTDDLKRKNAQAGLDIAVIDHYVGQTRPVNTLSGGESFMAALALALGLADVISRLAGASSLDTMFIDEGFGTLDEESLELAIKTLLNLQDTGRLVGIISHVKELREQIPARLEITSTHKGSTATFKL
ncbi:MAG: SMC family ATPase [Niameybacter sp.]